MRNKYSPDKHATKHYLMHSITTIANVPLALWVIYAVFSLKDANYNEMVMWMSHPVNIVAAILFVAVAFIHFALELQVVFEDYVANIPTRKKIILTIKTLFLSVAAITIFSIIKLTFFSDIS